jgi:hypothetical protein
MAFRTSLFPCAFPSWGPCQTEHSQLSGAGGRCPIGQVWPRPSEANPGALFTHIKASIPCWKPHALRGMIPYLSTWKIPKTYRLLKLSVSKCNRRYSFWLDYSLPPFSVWDSMITVSRRPTVPLMNSKRNIYAVVSSIGWWIVAGWCSVSMHPFEIY